MNDWGVADEHLFDFAARTVGDDRPSFNFIITTSNHPPYTVDLKANGICCRVPPELEPEFEFNRAKMLKVLGHHAYSDRSMGKFVEQEESRVSRPLFVITGDHYGGNFINSRPTLFEESAVPLILYGREVLRGATLPEGVAGSHLDIAPTLIESVAPKGFVYHAMGHNLLEPRASYLGYGGDRVIAADYVAEVGEVVKFAAIPGRPLPATVPDLAQLGRQCRNLQGIAWWRHAQRLRFATVPVARPAGSLEPRPGGPGSLIADETSLHFLRIQHGDTARLSRGGAGHRRRPGAARHGAGLRRRTRGPDGRAGRRGAGRRRPGDQRDPRGPGRQNLAHRGVTELRVVGSMHQRKALMAELADAFIALPGGFGTLEEYCEMLTWAQLGLQRQTLRTAERRQLLRRSAGTVRSRRE